MRYKPFDKQVEFLKDQSRIRVLIAAKRSGKSEACYIDNIIRGEKQIGYKRGPDPYMMGIIAPTENMLRRLVWPKFREFAKGFEGDFNKSDSVFKWNSNNTVIYGFSAEKISRMEGYKLNHIHITEAFQSDEHVFFESLARTSDTKGTISIEGSLGTTINNPKLHWIYRTFIEKQFEGARVWMWATEDNPHYPKDELERLRASLDPRTYRQMFQIDFNVPGANLVYDDFDESNVTRGYSYNKGLETIVSIDWGWNHPMACLFFQYDRRDGTVYLFDEIVGSKLTLDQLWDRIKAKGYHINHWICDIAGNQEREQTGISNISWFKQAPRNIHFKYRSTAINYGIPIVRSYIKNGLGQRKFFIDEVKCPKSLDNMKNYSYPQKDGMILNENPLKENDDCVDAIRYMFVNHLDYNIDKQPFKELNRWKF